MGKAKEQPGSGTGHGHCGAKTRAGGTCRKPAGWGTPNRTGRCRLHGGSTPNHVKKAQRQEAEQAVVTYGLPREIDPHDALLEELHRTAGHVAWLGLLISELERDELKQYASAGTFESSVDGEDRALVWEKPAIWVELYHRERQHYAKVAKTCVDVGIEERRIRIAEETGHAMADLIRGVLADLGHDLHDPKTREIVGRHLQLVQGGAA